MAVTLLILALVAGLVMIPVGLPGLWVMAGAVLVYSYAVPQGEIGMLTIGGVAVAAAVAEGLEYVLGNRYAKQYGGSSRAGWGAIAGGIVGAMVGVPLPVVGSMIGAFAGAFVGAWAAEYLQGKAAHSATRVATGALLGRVVAVAMKIGIGMMIFVWAVAAAML